jgi:hypothetical protein
VPGWRDWRRRGEEVTSASTYLQLGKDGEKAAEPRRLAGWTGGGEGSDQEGLQLG